MVERGTSGAVAGADRRALLGPRIVAAVVVVVSAFLIYQALQIAERGGYSVVGPATIPLVVAAVLLVLGLAFAVRTTVRPDGDLAVRVADEERATHWPTVGFAAAVLVVYALLLNGFRLGLIDVPGIGYVPATGLMLPAMARVLGSRHLVRDTITGFGLAIIVYIGFTQFLGVRLPAGLLGLIG